MIASLRGAVSHLAASACLLDVHGVGYRVALAPDHALELRLGQEASLATRLVVREDAMALYGFRDESEAQLFDLLVSVSGVGPKSAMGVLAQLAPAELARAVAEEDAAAFRRVSGVGPKTARLILVQLAGKLSAPAASPDGVADAEGGERPAAASPALRADVVEALVGLGYAERQAEPAVDAALAELGEAPEVGDALRAALRALGPARR